MIRARAGELPVLQFSLLASQPGLVHFVTTRAGGESPAPWDTLNLGFHTGDLAPRVEANRARLCRGLAIPDSGLRFPGQVHGNRAGGWRAAPGAGIAPQPAGSPPETCDALATDVANLCVAVMVADCVPILLYDPEKRVAAAVHAGWKGTLDGVAANAVELMRTEFGADPARLIAGIGPGIGPACYEVSAQVADRLPGAVRNPAGLTRPSPVPGRAFLDLWETNRRILIECGLAENRIETAGMCPHCLPETFYSHRRSGGITGRLAAGIMVRPA